LVRGLVKHISLHLDGDDDRVEIQGELASILALASGATNAKGAGETDAMAVQMKMVAGTRCHLYRTAFRWP
jgi:hypothetical protein